MVKKSNETKEQRKERRIRMFKVSLAVAAVLLISVGSTLGFAYAFMGGLESDFDRTYVTHQVNVNGDVTNVTNTSDVNAYIRTAILVTWRDSEGKARWVTPDEGTDYVLIVDADSSWSSDHAWYLDTSTNFYYHKASLAPMEITSDLISSITVLGTPPEGCELRVEVVAEAIQVRAESEEEWDNIQAVADAWSINIYG